MIVSWRFDGDDVLCAVGHEWDGFAQSNNGGHCIPPPIGSSLSGIVGDSQMYALWAAILQAGRQRAGRQLVVTFRCDAPSSRRTMRAEVLSQDGVTVEIVSRIASEEARPTVPLLDAAITDRVGEMIRMCSWCAKVRTDRWVEVEEACRALALLERDKLPPVTHGICEACIDAMTDELELPPGSLAGRRIHTSISSELRAGASQPLTS